MGSQSPIEKYGIQVPSRLGFDDAICIIDDQLDLRLIVMHQLKKLSYTNIKHFANGYEAVEFMQRERTSFHLYVCDQDMPVMGGLDFLNELREDPGLDIAPFCLTLENVQREHLMLAVESGADELLVKPYTLADIVPKVKRTFRRFHNPGNPELLYQLAKIKLRHDDLEGAEEMYRDLGISSPRSARPFVGMARICKARGDVDGAFALLKEAEARNEHFVHLYTLRAELYAMKKQWDEAVEEYRRAIHLSPLNAIRYKLAADTMFKVNRYREAIGLLNIAMHHKLDFPDLHHYLSQAYFAVKEYDNAAKHIRVALKASVDSVVYLNQLGICLKELGQMNEAQKTYNQILKLDPKNIAALYNKSVILALKDDHLGAMKLLQRAIEANPSFEQGRAKLQEIKQRLDKLDETA